MDLHFLKLFVGKNVNALSEMAQALRQYFSNICVSFID